MGFTVKRLLEIAAAEIGYKEKETNSQLDDKTANAGDDNYTKYARDLAAAGYYQASKQGYAWCDMFVDWCFLQLCGGDKAKAEDMICQTGLYGAGCSWSAKYYKQQDRFFTSDPQPGDQIFFNSYAHTGIVEKIEGGKVHTIEGNTSNMVARRTYTLGSSSIDGYGRPKYDAEDTADTPAPESTTENDLPEIHKGDIVSIKENSLYYTSGKEIPDWVIAKQWIVMEEPRGDRVVIDASTDGKNHICSAVNAKDLTVITSAKGDAPEESVVILPGTATTGTDEDVAAILDELLEMGMTLAGACGVLASIKHESGFCSNNLENRGNTELSMTDAEYTAAVDSGKYTNFGDDRCGYGLFQHTYPTRKAAMLTFFQTAQKSISDWKTQIAFMKKELTEGYKSVLAVLTSTTSAKEASDIFTEKYEAPANTEDAKEKRGKTAEAFYAKFAPAETPEQADTSSLTVNLPVLRKGDKGDTVKAMQALLIGYGYNCGSTGVDGSFGANTENALECYQEDNDLTVDAVCGPKTWGSLLGL